MPSVTAKKIMVGWYGNQLHKIVLTTGYESNGKTFRSPNKFCLDKKHWYCLKGIFLTFKFFVNYIFELNLFKRLYKERISRHDKFRE